MSYPELSMLRLLTNPLARRLPHLGNPPGTELVWNERCVTANRDVKRDWTRTLSKHKARTFMQHRAWRKPKRGAKASLRTATSSAAA